MPPELPRLAHARLPLAATLGAGLTRALALAASILILGLAIIPAGRPQTLASVQDPPGDDRDATDVLGANAACLVCHLTFVKEPLALTHQRAGVACTKCHGPSVAHANDEHVGATKPDLLYPRDKVDESCARCHKAHDVPARDVIRRFLDRKLPTKRAVVCTDCHGTHRIARGE